MAYTIDLSNQVALVTGGIQGIGLGVCKTLACAGASIAVCDILSEDDPKTQKGIGDIKKAGDVKVFYIKKDLAAQEQCYEVIDVLIEEFGRLDIFVANAGITGKDNNWDAAYNVNVKSVYYCYEKAKQYLVQSQGRIVIMSTASVIRAVRVYRNISAPRAGLTRLRDTSPANARRLA